MIRCPECEIGEACERCGSSGYVEEAVADDRGQLTRIGTAVEATLATVGAMVRRLADSGYDDGEVSPAEARLALELTERGIPFEQEHPIGPYFADFWFAPIRLVVEIDGAAYHLDEQKDERRTRYLLAHGVLRVRRLRALRVFTDPAGCVDEIEEWLR